MPIERRVALGQNASVGTERQTTAYPHPVPLPIGRVLLARRLIFTNVMKTVQTDGSRSADAIVSR